jgi:enoyl-CoA hydratase/carnithine racemase
MPDYETLDYREENGVAWVTLNRPQVYNAFNTTMTNELFDVWRSLRANQDVNAVVLTGAGEKAFCTGIDRSDIDTDWRDDLEAGGQSAAYSSPFMLDDPGQKIGPKTCDLWKPVIGAVNGMACGGAFYMLGECEFLIAADHATFFDPHVSYGMPAGFEPVHMLHKMPFGDIMRLSLMGNAERVSAARAKEIGLVTEVVPGAELAARARWVAETIASYPPLAVQATMRSLWTARDAGHKAALEMAYAFVAMGTTSEGLKTGQEAFASGKRVEWQLR